MTPGVHRRALAEGRPELERFRNTLAWAMAEKGLSASDLARAVWGETTDARGYTVARNRDRMTHYLAGTIYPSLPTVQKMAQVLDVDVSTLARDDNMAPNSDEKSDPASAKTQNRLEVSISVVAPPGAVSAMAMVTIHCPVSIETATQIAKLVSAGNSLNNNNDKGGNS